MNEPSRKLAGVWKTYDNSSGLLAGVICLLQDSNGLLWLGTYGGGLSCYDGGQLTNYTTQDGLAHDEVWALYHDRDDRLWIGTFGGGVTCYDGAGFVVYTPQDGLLEESVDAILQDTEGSFWFAHATTGLSRFEPEFFQPLCEDPVPHGGFTQDPEDRLWYGSYYQLGCIEGGAVVRRRLSAQVTAVLADRRVSRVELTTSAADRVTFQFRGISFKTNQMRYNYKLEGYDQDWRATWDEEATYEHLPAGEYRFQVIAINRDLIYSADPAVASVIVQPDPRDVRITALQTEIEHLRREVGRKYEFENIVGHSPAMQQVYALMEKAIDSGLTVLISGETGTGKELVAKAIHYHSSRKHKPLLELNCGAVPKDLIAATLFGSRKGAFTGAYEDSTGLFEAAAGGTVLLDEIGEMGKEAQIHLLRVLQEQKVQRLGETRLRDVDARIIAITNRDLEAEVQAGRFREDLYYRLNVFPIQSPALRDRVEDLPMTEFARGTGYHP